MTALIDRLWPDPAPDVTDEDLTKELGAGVRVNFISSIDGAATRDGVTGGLAIGGDKRYFELLRRLCDVVLVGAGTVRIEGYGPMRVSAASAAWRAARGMPEHPVFAIVSARLDLDPASRIFTDAPALPIVVTTSRAPGVDRFAGIADVLVVGDRKQIDAGAMLAGLRARGLTRILCEGGPSLFGSLLADDLVDDLCLTVSPSLEGGGASRITAGASVPRTLQLAQVLKSGDALLLRYTR